MLSASVLRVRCGECPGKGAGPSQRLCPTYHKETLSVDRPGRNQPVRPFGSKDLCTRLYPLEGLSSEQAAEDKVLFVLMICDPVGQELTAQG